jgi:hypothetical protein
MAFFHGRRSALVDVGSEIDKMDAALRLLTRLDPYNRKRDVAPKRFAEQLLNSQMAKKVTTYLVERYHGLAVVLRHQQEQSWCRMRCLIRHEQELVICPTNVSTKVNGDDHLSDSKSESGGELKDSAFVNGTHLNHASIVRRKTMRIMNLPKPPAQPISTEECIRIYLERSAADNPLLPHISALLTAYLSWPDNEDRRDSFVASCLALRRTGYDPGERDLFEHGDQRDQQQPARGGGS